MKKEQKNESIELAKGIFAENPVVILLNYKGLNAKGTHGLRKGLKAKGANIKVLKNTLVKRALGDANKEISQNLKDQVAISYSKDAVSLSNVLVKFSKDYEAISIQGGLMDGKTLTVETIKSLASLGSIDEVRAKFIGLLKGPGSALARVLSAYSQKQ